MCFWECCRIIQRLSDDVHVNQLVQAGKQCTLQLESTLVIRISEHEENVLEDAEEVLLEECVRNGRIGCSSKVVDDFETHYFEDNQLHVHIEEC